MARGNDALLHQSQEDTMKYPVDPGGRIAGGRRIGGVRRMHLGRLRLQTVCHGRSKNMAMWCVCGHADYNHR